MATHAVPRGHEYQGARADGNAVAHFGDKIYNISDRPKVDLLAALAPVAEARWNSAKSERRHEQCLAGTRARVLDLIQAWTSDDSAHGIFWLAGMAGTGKSTIAMTICQGLSNEGCALATFFFERGAGAIASTARLLCTITYQLAMQWSKFKEELARVVEDDPTITHLSMSAQLTKLLLDPLRKLKLDRNNTLKTVLVLDALDECDSSEDVQLFLSLLSEVADLHALELKILVTSRPDWPIRSMFHSAHGIIHEELQLHKEDRAHTDSDIKLYIQHRLARVTVDRRIAQPWPTEDEIDKLVVLSAGLFIFAATCCRYLNAPPNVSPAKRLATVCDGSPHKALLTHELDRMYSIILEGAFAGEYEDDELNAAKQQCREVLTGIILSFETLSSRTLSQLIQIPECDVKSIIDSMSAVLDQDDAGVIQILHESFRDYLTDEERCFGTDIFVDAEQGEWHIAQRCLLVMEKELCEDICRLEFPNSPRFKISSELVERYISESLRYSCQYWMRHILELAEFPDDDGEVHTFLTNHLQRMMEVMSILGRIPECISEVSRLEAITKPASPVLSSYLDNVRRFLLAYQDGIRQYPLQIYSCYAYFAPIRLCAQSHAVGKTSRGLLLKTDAEEQWEPHRLVMHCQGTVESLEICADGSRLAVISKTHTDDDVTRWILGVFNTTSGEKKTLIDSHCQVESVFLSTEGDIVVSVNSRKLRVWNSDSGRCLCSLDDQRFEILSEDGAAFATKSVSHQIHFWKTTTGEHLKCIDGVECTAIANGKALVRLESRAWQVWDLETCRLSASLPGNWNGHVQLSSCGTFLLETGVDPSWPGQLRHYDIVTGNERRILQASELRQASGPGAQVLDELEPRTLQSHISKNGAKFAVFIRLFDGWRARFGYEMSLVDASVTDHKLSYASRLSIERDDEAQFHCFTDDGQLACFGTHRSITCVRKVSNGAKQRLARSIRLVRDSTKSEDLKYTYSVCRYLPIIATSYGSSLVHVHDIEFDNLIGVVAVSSNGRLLASFAGDGRVQLWRIESGTRDKTVLGPRGIPHRLRISNDLRFVAGVCYRGIEGTSDAVVWLWEVSRNQVEELGVISLEGDAHGRYKPELEFSPDGCKLRFDLTHIWETQSRMQQPLHQVENVLLWPQTRISALTGSITYADDWACIDGEPEIWFPEEFRPESSSAVAWSESLQTLCIGSRAGKHTFVRKDTAGPFLDSPSGSQSVNSVLHDDRRRSRTLKPREATGHEENRQITRKRVRIADLVE